MFRYQNNRLSTKVGIVKYDSRQEKMTRMTQWDTLILRITSSVPQSEEHYIDASIVVGARTE
jgi:hypothetical protein